MAFDRAKTNLGVIEDKLRKFFNLAGTIGTAFEPTITPVYVVGDARDAGVANFKGRKFSWSSDAISTPLVAGDCFGLTWAVPVIINGIGFNGAATALSFCDCYYLAPDDPALGTWVGNRVTGTWSDQKSLTADTPPLLDRAAKVNIAVANGHQKRIASWVVSTNGHVNDRLPMNIQSPAGGAILFSLVGSFGGPALGHLSIWGEIQP